VFFLLGEAAMKRRRQCKVTKAEFRQFKSRMLRAKAEERLRLTVDGDKRENGPRTDANQQPRRLPKAMRRGYSLRLVSTTPPRKTSKSVSRVLTASQHAPRITVWASKQQRGEQ